jgi:hypothetical protein
VLHNVPNIRPFHTIGRVCLKFPPNTIIFPSKGKSSLSRIPRGFNGMPFFHRSLIPQDQRSLTLQFGSTALLCEATIYTLLNVYWYLKAGMCGLSARHNRSSYTRRSCGNSNLVLRSYCSKECPIKKCLPSTSRTIKKEYTPFGLSTVDMIVLYVAICSVLRDFVTPQNSNFGM